MIFDDIIDTENSQHSNKLLSYIATNGRHYHISCIISTQYLNSIPPAVRSNADLIFIFKTISKKCCDIIIDNYLALIDRDRALHKLEKYTDNYKTLVVDNTTNNLKLYWYIASIYE
jgi:hypothetical protein